VANLLTADQKIFDPGIVAVSPVLLLVAAAFGLAPSRLFTAVTGLSEQILIQAQLSSSTATGGPAKDKGPDDGSGEGED
jgi:hypothetical protein